jgi:predicted thioesterase
MVALMEAAAVDCVERLLGDGQESLGVRVDIDHTAGTPVGLAVTATAELKEIDGRKLRFLVEARDAREIIGKGRHERIVVDTERFRAKVRAKGNQAD